MRRILAVVALVALVAAAGAKAAAQPTVLRVGASTLPHAPILEFIKPMLAEEGIELQIIEFSDYVLPNLALAEGDIDANFFQHIPYLEDFAANHRLDLTWTVKVFLAPIGLYSHKIKSIDELPRGATIAIPNDVTNGGRALALLAKAGLLELREGVEGKATVFDIVRNPLNLRIIELEAPLLPRALEDVDAAFINQTYALEAGFKPLRDAILLESGDSPYANVVAVRREDANNPAIQKLGEVLTRPEVREFILEYFEGSLIPVF
ncbi:MAG: MetQ/NlpA family ABC transporter substrate-binding protein [Bacillota bacterium]|nr:methionine ABC transporter substrate-binding protein [Bacillota bacterium]REJ36727.1 MAG: methionine ABC transporter substrate-binding protein [Bacillota bacterium]